MSDWMPMVGLVVLSFVVGGAVGAVVGRQRAYGGYDVSVPCDEAEHDECDHACGALYSWAVACTAYGCVCQEHGSRKRGVLTLGRR